MRDKINFSEKQKLVNRMMLLSIFIDQMNVFEVPMISVFIRSTFIHNSYLFGISTGAIIGGASIGSILGGILSDRIGRKPVYVMDIIIFILTSIGSAFAPNVTIFIFFRFVAGIAVGADLANCYCFIMDNNEPRKREITATKNTLMASFSILAINISVLFMILYGTSSSLMWRVVLLLPVAPAILSLILSFKISDVFDFKIGVENPFQLRGYWKYMKSDTTRWRTTVFSWISGISSSIEVGTFAFFLPLIINNFSIQSLYQQRLLIIFIYSFGVPAGYLGPRFLPKLGLRKISYIGYFFATLAIIGTGVSIYYRLYLAVPFFMILFVWGNHWNSQSTLPSQSLVVNMKYRGTATGVSNFISEVPEFMSISVFPAAIAYLGLSYSTLIISVAPIIGFLASIFVFKEIYGYRHDLLNTSMRTDMGIQVES